MTQLDFFADDDDFYAVMDFVFRSTDLLVFEAYSRIDEAIRQFSSVDDLRSVADERQKGSFLLRAWQPVDGYAPTFKSIRLEPHLGTHRTCLEGAGVIQFQQGSIEDGLLRASCFSHWDEAGARQRGFYPADPVNWRSLRTVSGRVYRLTKKNWRWQSYSQAQFSQEPLPWQRTRTCFGVLERPTGSPIRKFSSGRPNYSFKGNQNRSDFAPLNSGVRS